MPMPILALQALESSAPERVLPALKAVVLDSCFRDEMACKARNINSTISPASPLTLVPQARVPVGVCILNLPQHHQLPLASRQSCHCSLPFGCRNQDWCSLGCIHWAGSSLGASEKDGKGKTESLSGETAFLRMDALAEAHTTLTTDAKVK